MALCALKASIILWLLLGNCFSSFSLTEISDRGDVHCVGSLQFGAPDSLVHASCDGDIVMTGRYFEVGMHRAGSLGTSSSIVSPIATAMPGAPLGMNADYDRNGFDAYSACNIVDPWYYYGGTPQEVCPTYAGDFVTPGAPVEGWVLQWSSPVALMDANHSDAYNVSVTDATSASASNTTAATTRTSTIRNLGAVNIMDAMPTAFIPVASLALINASTYLMSSIWVGHMGNIELLSVSSMRSDGFVIHTSVKLRNIGSTVLTDVLYERTVDPDNELFAYHTYVTNNFVKYQPSSWLKDSTDFKNFDHPNAALVTAVGSNNPDFYVSLLAIDPRARVSHYGLAEMDPSQILLNDLWRSYGGRDVKANSPYDTYRMRTGDEGIQIVYRIGSLSPGEVAQMSFSYVTTFEAEDSAFTHINALRILQPVFSMSGTHALVAIYCNYSLDNISVWIYGVLRQSNTSDWYLATSSSSCRETNYAHMTIDTTLFYDGIVEILASSGQNHGAESIEATSVVFINNTGEKLMFETDDSYSISNPVAFYNSVSTMLKLVKDNASHAMGHILQVNYYRECFINDVMESKYVASSLTHPFDVMIDTSDLALGTHVYIRAEVQSICEVIVSTTTSVLYGIVKRMNQAPTNIELQPPDNVIVSTEVSIPESSPAGFLVGYLSAMDVDSHPNVLSFTMLVDAGGVFMIGNRNELRTLRPLDFEQEQSFEVSIQVNDGSPVNCCLQKSFQIYVSDVNEPPEMISSAIITVAENVPLGSVVHTLIAIDPDVGQAVSFTLLTPLPHFRIDIDSGDLILLGELDFEATPEYVIRVRLTDTGSPAMHADVDIHIEVIDINEPPSAIWLDCAESSNGGSACAIAEETAYSDAPFMHIRSMDPDERDTLRYAVKDAHELFRCDPTTGAVYLAKSVNYELSGGTFAIQVTATDRSGLSITDHFTITVIDIPEPPLGGHSVCYANENENIGSVAASDITLGYPCTVEVDNLNGALAPEIEYEILEIRAGNSVVGNGSFFIQSCSGILFVNTTLDFESIGHYYLSIAVISPNGIGIATIEVFVIDQNETPNIVSTSFALFENSPVGTLVGSSLTLLVNDPDKIDGPFCCDLMFSIIRGNTAGFFAISDVHKDRLVVAHGVLNFESKERYPLIVQVNDKGGLSHTATIEIIILDINEPPIFVNIRSDQITLTIPEHTSTGSFIGDDIIISDPDFGQSVSLSVQHDEDFNCPVSLLQSNEASGVFTYRVVVTNSALLDFETNPTCNVTLIASDSGSPAEATNANLCIRLVDVNEPPVFVLPCNYSLSIREDAQPGSHLIPALRLFWSDPDVGDYPTFAISSKHGDQYDAFLIDSMTGLVSLNTNTLDFESKSHFDYDIIVYDRGGFSASARVVIDVLDVPEAPVFGSFVEGYIRENDEPGAVVEFGGQALVYTAADDDSNDTLTFALESVNDIDCRNHKSECPFVIRRDDVDSLKFFIRATQVFDFEETSRYSIKVSVTDGVFFSYKNTTVNILDQNDSPMIAPSMSCNVGTQMLWGTEVCTIFAFDSDSQSIPWGRLNYSIVTTDDSALSWLSITTRDNVGYLVITSNITEANIGRFNVSISVADGGGLSASSIISLYIVQDVFAPECPLHEVIYEVHETASANTIIGYVMSRPNASADFAITGAAGSEELIFVRIISGNSMGSFVLNETTGELRITRSHAIDFETKERYTLLIQATYVGSDTPLSTTCQFIVQVLDDNEPTTFEPQVIIADENLKPGAFLSHSGLDSPRIFVIDEDIADHYGSFSIECLNCRTHNPFEINSTSGQLYLSRDGHLNFEVQPEYALNCTWSSRGVFAYTSVTVIVIDLPEAPIIIAEPLTALETTSVSRVGQIRAWDPDYEERIDFSNTSCGGNCGLTYILAGSLPNSRSFRLDPISGELFSEFLDFEDVAVYTLSVRVMDSYGLTGTALIELRVQDLPDCSITNVISSQLGSRVSQASTTGGGNITIYGTNFGPTQKRTLNGNIGEVVISAFIHSHPEIESSEHSFELIGCVLNATNGHENSAISCMIPPGIGGNLFISVLLDVTYESYLSSCLSNPRIPMLSYAQPLITTLVRNASFQTNGGETFDIVGINFGPLRSGHIEVAYWNSFIEGTLLCYIKEADVRLSCLTNPGIGRSVNLQVIIGNQPSNVFALAMAYNRPTITSVHVTEPLRTRGGDVIVIHGFMFGDIASAIRLAYASESGREWIASCILLESHSSLQCTSAPGFGRNLSMRVSIGDQFSESFSTCESGAQCVSYAAPVIESISGPGVVSASTTGGDVVYIRGANFGALDTADLSEVLVVQYKRLDESHDRLLSASRCRMTLPHIEIECLTSPGTGEDWAWSVKVAGQASRWFDGNTSYAPPVVYYHSGNSDGVATVGNESVKLYGANFGSDDSTITQVYYSNIGEDGPIFDVTSGCTIDVPHTIIRCKTIPGAGKGMSWFVTIDGLSSSLQTFSYKAPSILSLEGPGASNASVFGGDEVLVTGANFGPPGFDVSVTYGIIGTEYVARNCSILDHMSIRCITCPGVGSELRWIVSIAGQSSSPSLRRSNYASPQISLSSPISGLIPTDGGTSVVLHGSNLAPFSFPRLLCNGISIRFEFLSQDSIRLHPPPSKDRGSDFISVSIQVGNQLSNVVWLEYQPPHIASAALVDNGNSTYALVIQGTSFTLDAAVVLIDLSNKTTSRPYCHYRFYSEIRCTTAFKAGFVYVYAGPRRVSNTYALEQDIPTVGYVAVAQGRLLSDGYTQSNPVLLVIFGQRFGLSPYAEITSQTNLKHTCEIVSLKTISYGSDYAQWHKIAESMEVIEAAVDIEVVECKVPPGEGIKNSLQIYRGNSRSLGCGCSICNNASCLAYLPPSLQSISASFGATVGRTEIAIHGESFGINPFVRVGNLDCWIDASRSSHSALIVLTPPGEGSGLSLRVTVGGQTSVEPFLFSYNPPYIDTPLHNLRVGTDGSGPDAIAIRGGNFGIYGPEVFLGSTPLQIIRFNHTQFEFFIPPGQGTGFYLTVSVGGQTVRSSDVFSYLPPSIHSVFRNETQTVGGRASNVSTVLVGENFGSIDGNFGVFIGSTRVDESDILSYSSRRIEFFAPEGTGRDILLSIFVSSQANAGTRALFSYSPPNITDVLLPLSRSTLGGYVVQILGTSFGTYGATATIESSDIGDSDLNSTLTKYLMPETICRILVQSHGLLRIVIPPGVGSNLTITIRIGAYVIKRPFSYDAPSIEYVMGSRGGDASGQEIISIYGASFGSYSTPAAVYIGAVPCREAQWSTDDASKRFEPFVRCISLPMSVGYTNTSLHVGLMDALDLYSKFRVECKRGSFGAKGEYCTPCGDQEITGMVCDSDGMARPYSAEGFYIVYLRTPSSLCSEQSQAISTQCPAALPCMPSRACTGNNTCSAGYTGERCSECAEGYFRINGECQICPEHTWAIPCAIAILIIIGAVGGYVLYLKNFNFGIFGIGLDYLQVLAIFSQSQLQWPKELEYFFNALSAFNFNIDLLSPECYNQTDLGYKTLWSMVALVPVILVGVMLFSFAIFAVASFIAGRSNRGTMRRSFYRIIGFLLSMYYWCYLMVSTNTMEVFNCQATEPPDGHEYMVAVGTDSGLCYRSGTMQQELEPFAYLSLLGFSIGYPLLVAVCLYYYRSVAVLDQLRKASQQGEDAFNDCVYSSKTFLDVFRRSFQQYKPQYCMWILVILARKFLLSVSAVIFRENSIFLISFYLFVLFTAYALHLRCMPYMGTADYDSIVEDSQHFLPAALRPAVEKRTIRKAVMKTVRLGGAPPKEQATFELRIESFLDYNAVEGTLLMSTIFVSIAALMFESNKLDGAQTDALTWVTLAAIAATCLYFAWVVLYEVIILLSPHLCLIGNLKIDSEDIKCKTAISDSTTTEVHLPDVGVDSCKLAMGENAISAVQKQKTEILALQGELESVRVQVQRYQQEIDRLKRRPPQVGSSSHKPLSATSGPSRLPTPEAFASSRMREQRYTPYLPHRFVDVRRGSGKHHPGGTSTSNHHMEQPETPNGVDLQSVDDIETIAYFENPINTAR